MEGWEVGGKEVGREKRKKERKKEEKEEGGEKQSGIGEGREGNLIIVISILLQDGCTPLIVHSERGHNDVVMELCKQGALIDIPDQVCKLL